MPATTHTLHLTFSASTFDLNSGGSSILLEYVPQYPDLSTVDTNSILEDGSERPITTRRNVTETARVLLSTSAHTDLENHLYAIQQAFNAAEYYQKGRGGSPTYIYYAASGMEGAAGQVNYRSEVLSGKYELFDRSLDWRWAVQKVEAQLTWTRRYYWEGAVTAVKIRNPSGSSASTLTVFNHHEASGSRTNYINIEGSALAAEIPSPAKLYIYHPGSGSSLSTRRFHVGQNVWSNPSSFPHILECETGASATQGGGASTVSGSINSACAYVSFPIPAGLTSAVGVCGWTLAGSFLNLCDGGIFNVLLRWAGTTISGSVYGQLKVMYPATLTPLTVLAEGPEIALDTSVQMQSLGSIRLPPSLNALTGFDNLGLWLYTRASAAQNLFFDFFQFTPTNGYRLIKQPGYAWTGGHLVIDETTENVYFSASDANETSKLNLFTKSGKKIAIFPRLDQRLYFLIADANAMYANRQYSVKVTYRPRRLIL